jgi:hypothetical protein
MQGVIPHCGMLRLDVSNFMEEDQSHLFTASFIAKESCTLDAKCPCRVKLQVRFAKLLQT